VNDRNDLSRGDRNRNDKLAQLRELLPVTNAIVGIDLADNKQAAVVTDHDSRVLARRTLSCRSWELGELLDWVLRFLARVSGTKYDEAATKDARRRIRGFFDTHLRGSPD
jgi:hypothetical protein